jgi:hypothetical protein
MPARYAALFAIHLAILLMMRVRRQVQMQMGTRWGPELTANSLCRFLCGALFVSVAFGERSENAFRSAIGVVSVGELGFSPAKRRISAPGRAEYKPAALPLSYSPEGMLDAPHDVRVSCLFGSSSCQSRS